MPPQTVIRVAESPSCRALAGAGVRAGSVRAQVWRLFPVSWCHPSGPPTVWSPSKNGSTAVLFESSVQEQKVEESELLLCSMFI